MVALAAVLLLVVGVAIFLATKALVADGDAEEATTAAPRSPRSVAGSSSVDAGPDQESTECGEVATTDAYGNPLPAIEPLVRGIHDAACRRDFPALLPFMADSFGYAGYPKQDVVAEWERQGSDGLLLQTLAETLEMRAVGDQGGWYFCHPGGAVAVFARGTYDRPGMWSDFDLTRTRIPTACERAA
jgi:hypothetical protein